MTAVGARPASARRETHRILSRDGTGLHVLDVGPQDAPALVLLHGLGLNGLVWHDQVAALAADHRVIAVDLRGHGGSDKPLDAGYSNAQVWADDLDAVLRALTPGSPVLVAWSYAGMVAADYLQRHGADDVAGVCLVAPLRKIGTPDAVHLLGEQFLALVPGLLSEDRAEGLEAARQFLGLVRAGAWPESDYYQLLGAALSVPPAVIGAMLSREQDNDVVWESAALPVMIAYGTDDAVIRPSSSEDLARIVSGADPRVYEGAGHAVFSEQPDRFNADLTAFAESCR